LIASAIAALGFDPLLLTVRRKRGARWLAGSLALAALLAVLSVSLPLPLVGIVGLSIAGAILIATLGVERCLLLSFLLTIVGETKFRARNPGELLAGNLDWEVGLELASYALLALLSVAGFVRLKRRDLRLEGIEIPLSLYAGLALLSTSWSVEPRLSAVRGIQQIILLFYSLVCVRLISPARILDALKRTLTGYVLGCTALALVFPWAAYAHSNVRFSWFAVHPIIASEEAGVALILFIVDALFRGEYRTTKRERWWHRVAMIALPAIILATRARGPIIALFAVLIVLVGLRYLGPNIGLWMIGLGLAGGLIWVVTDFSLADSLQTVSGSGSGLNAYILRQQSAGEVMTLSGRIGLWKAIYRLILARPVIGYGFVASRSVLLEWFPWAGEAHNAMLESLLNLGLVGCLLLWSPLLYVVGNFFRPRVQYGIRVRWETLAVIAMLVFLLVVGFDSASFAGFITYDPTYFAVAMALHQQLRREAGRRISDKSMVNYTSGAYLPEARLRQPALS
jgi:O-antigen ligase